MGKVLGGIWTLFEWSPRQYALREFFEILVDDRPICREVWFKHARVQSKAVFSVTVMVWEDEENGS